MTQPTSTIEPRLLWLTDNYYPNKGGMAESCDRIVHGLRQRGIYIEIVHFHKKLKTRAGVKRNGRYTPCSIFPDSEHAISSLWHIEEQRWLSEKFTHVIIWGGNSAITAGAIFAKWLSASLVTCLRGNDFDMGIFAPRRQAVLMNALQSSKHVCSVTNEKAVKVKKLFPEIDSLWTPNGINTDEWCSSNFEEVQAKEWREENVPSDRKVIGVFGHLKQKKGLTFFINALRRSGMIDQFSLLLIGELDEQHTEALLQQEELHWNHIPFIERYALIPYYLASDFIAIPSFYEGMPNVLIEGAALGRPFICSTAGGMGDILTHNEHGFLFQPGDMAGARKAIFDAARITDNAYEKMSDATKLLMKEQYCTTKEINRYESLFREGVMKEQL